jgi:hypothetical protein
MAVTSVSVTDVMLAVLELRDVAPRACTTARVCVTSSQQARVNGSMPTLRKLRPKPTLRKLRPKPVLRKLTRWRSPGEEACGLVLLKNNPYKATAGWRRVSRKGTSE